MRSYYNGPKVNGLSVCLCVCVCERERERVWGCVLGGGREWDSENETRGENFDFSDLVILDFSDFFSEHSKNNSSLLHRLTTGRQTRLASLHHSVIFSRHSKSLVCPRNKDQHKSICVRVCVCEDTITVLFTLFSKLHVGPAYVTRQADKCLLYVSLNEILPKYNTIHANTL